MFEMVFITPDSAIADLNDIWNHAQWAVNKFKDFFAGLFGIDQSSDFDVVSGFGTMPAAVGPNPKTWLRIRADNVFDAPVGYSWESKNVSPETVGFRDEDGFHWFFGETAEAHLYNNGVFQYSDKSGTYIDSVKVGSELKQPPPSPVAKPSFVAPSFAVDKPQSAKEDIKDIKDTTTSGAGLAALGLIAVAIGFGWYASRKKRRKRLWAISHNKRPVDIGETKLCKRYAVSARARVWGKLFRQEKGEVLTLMTKGLPERANTMRVMALVTAVME